MADAGGMQHSRVSTGMAANLQTLATELVRTQPVMGYATAHVAAHTRAGHRDNIHCATVCRNMPNT